MAYGEDRHRRGVIGFGFFGSLMFYIISLIYGAIELYIRDSLNLGYFAMITYARGVF